MKTIITSILSLIFFSLSISQSPFSLDQNELNVTFGNFGYHSGNKVVQVTNIDSIDHPLVWEVGALPEGVHVSIIDGILTYANDMNTICGNSIVPYTIFSPGYTVSLGFYNITIDSFEQMNFPSYFSIFIVDPSDCNIKLDTIIVNLRQASIEEYDVSFNKEEIDIHLVESTGSMAAPHEELKIFNSSEFSADFRWRINDNLLPQDIRFLIDHFNNDANYSLGDHSNCEVVEQWVINNSQFGKDFHVEKVDATALEDWSGFPYKFTIDLLLPDCETVLDSVVVHLLNGTTATEDDDRFDISIYPNPVANTLYVDSDIKISKIRIIDIQGQLQSETSLNHIDISDLKAGVYIASIMDQTGTIINRKFMVE